MKQMLKYFNDNPHHNQMITFNIEFTSYQNKVTETLAANTVDYFQ